MANMNIFSRSKRFRNALAHYSEVLSPKDNSNEVISPFALWMMLAATLQITQAKNPSMNMNSVSEKALHMTMKEVDETLKSVRNIVDLNFAVWGNQEYAAWLEVAQDFIPTSFELPTQAELNKWASDNTRGLITEFPLDIDSSNPDIVLANALVSDLTWIEPFDVVEAREDKFDLNTVLHKTYKGLSTVTMLTSKKGDKVLKLTFHADDNKTVRVFIPENGSEMTSMQLNRFMVKNYDKHEPLPEDFTLDAHGWGESTPIRAMSNQLEVTIPAWEVETKVDLNDSEEIKTVMKHSFPGAEEMKACQVAKASFRKDGLTAAAVTGLFIARASMMLPGEFLNHHVIVNNRFGFVVEEQNLPLFIGNVNSSSFTEA